MFSNQFLSKWIFKILLIVLIRIPLEFNYLIVIYLVMILKAINIRLCSFKIKRGTNEPIDYFIHVIVDLQLHVFFIIYNKI